MKYITILALILSKVEAKAASTIAQQNAENLDTHVEYWILSIAGSSIVVWLIVRFLYGRSKLESTNKG